MMLSARSIQAARESIRQDEEIDRRAHLHAELARAAEELEAAERFVHAVTSPSRSALRPDCE